MARAACRTSVPIISEKLTLEKNRATVAGIWMAVAMPRADLPVRVTCRIYHRARRGRLSAGLSHVLDRVIAVGLHLFGARVAREDGHGHVGGVADLQGQDRTVALDPVVLELEVELGREPNEVARPHLAEGP